METDKQINFNIADEGDEFSAIFSSVFGDSSEITAVPEKPDISESESAYADSDNISYDFQQETAVDDFNIIPEQYPMSYEEQEYNEASSDYQDEQTPDSYSEQEEITFDPRFKIGKRRNTSFTYAGNAVNHAQDFSYDQAYHSSDNSEFTSSYAENEYDVDIAAEESSDRQSPKKKRFGLFDKKAAKKAKEDTPEPTQDFHDSFKGNSEASAEEDFIDLYPQESESEFSDTDYEDELPSSFGQFLFSRFTGFFIKLRGGIPSDSVPGSAPEEDDSEDLGNEVPLINASKYYGSQIHSLQARLRISVALLVLECYIACGLPSPGMLKSTSVAAAACLAFHFMIMLLSLDIFTNGILNIFRKQFGADSLAAVSCLITAVDGLLVIYEKVPVHMPLCAISSFSLVGILLSSLLSAKALRKTLRVPAIGKQIYTVTAERGVIGNGKESTVLKSSRPADGFVRRSEEAPLDEDVFRKSAPFFAAAAFLFTVIVAVVKNDTANALYILSAVFVPCVPFSALLSFALPFFVNSYSLFTNGVAIAGWSGAVDIGNCQNLIVTDRDLFPENCVKIENVRIFADYDSNKVISYAGSMIISSGCSLSSAFKNLMEENECDLLNVDIFDKMPGGGLRGMIDGHIVICGSTDLMRLMDVKIPYRLVSNTSVLLSIDGTLYGIFNVAYSADPSVRKGLVSLMRSTRHPVFAIRDFNITPDLISETFDVATDGYDFPPYAERFVLSESKPAKDSKISAAVGREGLGPLIAMVDSGRNLYTATKTNVVITLFSAVLGILIVFLKLLATGSISLSAILIYMVISFLPILLVGILSISIK